MNKNPNNNDVVVSVICTVYNHGKYIRQTLESLICQITNFKYEIVVHDDASTDNSADIIREFEKRYPDKIVAIYQTENQYSKKINIGEEIIYPICKGKYFASCEGDDYWIDETKLQRQYEILESHPQIDMCACGAYIEDAALGRQVGMICPRNSDCIISANEVILGGGNFLATNSLFYRKEIVTVVVPFREKLKFDYTIQINGSLKGGIYYLGKIMSVYRQNVPGSWTDRTKNDRNAFANNRKNIIEMLETLNSYTDGKYNSEIQEAELINKFNYYRALNEEKKLMGKEYKKLRKQLKMINKIWFYIKAIFY